MRYTNRHPASRRAARAVARSFPFEMIMLAGIFLLLGLMALPAHAAMEQTTGIYTKTNAYGQGFALQGSASGLADEKRAALAHEAVDKNFLISGTVIKPTVFGTSERPMNLYMTAGAGVAMQDRSYIETASRNTGVEPAFRVGMGIKYNF